MCQASYCMGGNHCISYGNAGMSPFAFSFFQPAKNAQTPDISQNWMLASSFTHRATPLQGPTQVPDGPFVQYHSVRGGGVSTFNNRRMSTAGRGGFWPRAAAAVRPSAALNTWVRIPFGKPKRNTRRTCGSRRPALTVTGSNAAGVLCLVPPFCYVRYRGVGKELRGRDTPPVQRRYRWWRGMLKVAVAGTSPTGSWTDRRTGVRTPDDNERHPWRIPLDRPSLLPYSS